MLKMYVINEALNDIAPLELQESWDNSGIQIFSGNEDVNKILVALEITDAVIDEAISEGVQLIVTHHPFYFGSFKSVDNNTVKGNQTIKLIKNNISVYSSHTPFDKAEGGNNTELSMRLGLINTEVLRDCRTGEELIGGIGELAEELTLAEFTEYVATSLKLDKTFVHAAGKSSSVVKKVGFCTGAGAEFAEAALENGCDVFVTGDVKYHDAQNALSLGISIVDAGHFGTEYIFIENMSSKLKERLGEDVEILQSQIDINPFIC